MLSLTPTWGTYRLVHPVTGLVCARFTTSGFLHPVLAADLPPGRPPDEAVFLLCMVDTLIRRNQAAIQASS